MENKKKTNMKNHQISTRILPVCILCHYHFRFVEALLNQFFPKIIIMLHGHKFYSLGKMTRLFSLVPILKITRNTNRNPWATAKSRTEHWKWHKLPLLYLLIHLWWQPELVLNFPFFQGWILAPSKDLFWHRSHMPEVEFQ